LTSASGSAWLEKDASGAQYVLQASQPLPASQASKNFIATSDIDAMFFLPECELPVFSGPVVPAIRQQTL
jgi:hypothetical protein